MRDEAVKYGGKQIAILCAVLPVFKKYNAMRRFGRKVVYFSEHQIPKGREAMKSSRHLSCIAACLALLLTDCAGQVGSPVTMADICIFHQQSDGVPIKTVITSGITSSVCVDPLCLHDVECPLYDIQIEEHSDIPIGDIYCFVRGILSVQAYTGGRAGIVHDESG